jgi:hypothetical protein
MAFASDCLETDANASGSKRPRVSRVVCESFIGDSFHHEASSLPLAPVTPIASSSRFIPTIPETLPQPTECAPLLSQAPYQHSRGAGSVALCTTSQGGGADDDDDEDEHVLMSPESIPSEWTASKTHIILFTHIVHAASDVAFRSSQL